MKQLNIRRFSIVCMLVAPIAWTQEQGPSFDCDAAQSGSEHAICADPGLAALDRRLTEVYSAALASWPADIAAEQRALQRGWIKGRDECWKADDMRECIETEYRTRIVALQIQSGQLMAPTTVGLSCEGEEDKPATATFYSETDPPSVVLTYGDDQTIAFRVQSGSGTRYATDGVDYWEHQGEATIDFYGNPLVCEIVE